jgi:DMSO reductase family type II enzyme heme b subunit
MRRSKIHFGALAAIAAWSVGCTRTAPHSNEVVSIAAGKIPLDPTGEDWRGLPVYAAKLLPQDLVDPRLMKASTPEVHVQSMNNGVEIAFRLEWPDATANDLPGTGRFLDGCAVQLPRKIASEPPQPQMGEAGRAVDIVFWRADWQASVNGRQDSLQALYPNATADHYPFEAKALEPGSPAQKEMALRYAPAAALGNRRVGPREFPVEDLVAEGPGSLAPAPASSSRGRGVRTKEGWSVVMVRRYPEGLSAKTRTQVAFAVWDGSQQEVGARKMRSGWAPLVAREAAK